MGTRGNNIGSKNECVNKMRRKSGRENEGIKCERKKVEIERN